MGSEMCIRDSSRLSVEQSTPRARRRKLYKIKTKCARASPTSAKQRSNARSAPRSPRAMDKKNPSECPGDCSRLRRRPIRRKPRLSPAILYRVLLFYDGSSHRWVSTTLDRRTRPTRFSLLAKKSRSRSRSRSRSPRLESGQSKDDIVCVRVFTRPSPIDGRRRED